ncbi:MAG: sigma-70 family RNA polymerase sigma factor [Acidobacteriota bacterium]
MVSRNAEPGAVGGAADLRNLSGTPDLDLVKRHRYGDASAFEEIYARFGPMVYNLCFRMSSHAEEAEDLTQEIFIRIHRHLARFDGRAALKTWIYRITLNYCRSKLGRKRYPTRPLAEEYEEEGVQLVEGRRGPEDRALARDAGRVVARALRQLKPKFREAVVLRDIEGLSYDEIADILKVRIGTVRSRIARGRDRLRVVLEKMPS